MILEYVLNHLWKVAFEILSYNSKVVFCKQFLTKIS
jgi:hypothetical protein